MSAEQSDEQPLWVHRRGDVYLPIAVSAWMNESGHGTHYRLMAGGSGHKQAIRTGFEQQDSDDFNVGVVRGCYLVALLWMHRVVDDDPSVLAAVAEQLGLEVAS